jgi:hypothetical protein
MGLDDISIARKYYTAIIITAGAYAITAPTHAIVFSAGQTDYTVLTAAPASSALYGFAFPAASGTQPVVNLTLSAANGTFTVTVNATIASAGSGNVCDASW